MSEARSTEEEVRHLAQLARIAVSDEELPKFAKEFEAILAYVGQLEKLEISAHPADNLPVVRNVFREDADAQAKGVFTEKLVEQFPAKEGDLLSVKQIITHE